MTKIAKDRKIKWEAQLSEDFKWLSSTGPGRRILAWMFGWGQVFQEIQENDPIRLAMAVGENNFAKRIARYVAMQPEVFTEAMNHNDEVAKSWMGDEEFREQMRAYMSLTTPPHRMDS